MNLTVDTFLTDPPSNELCVLRTVVQYEDPVASLDAAFRHALP